MSRNIRQHLADLSGTSVRSFNYAKFANIYGSTVQKRDAEDLKNEVERERSVAFHDRHVDWMKRAVGEAIEKESADVNGALPVISSFEAVQVVKSAAKSYPRDIGVLNLATHLEKRWKYDRDSHLTASDVLMLKNHYNSNYPKSAATGVIENFSKEGYFDLPVGKLMDLAAQIRDQSDYDYYIKEAGLHTNNPYNKKARQFILALLNGESERTAQSGFEVDEEDTFGEPIPEVEEMRRDLSDVGLYYDPSVAESTLDYHLGVEDAVGWVMIQGFKDMMNQIDESNMEVVTSELDSQFSQYVKKLQGEYAVRVFENGMETPAYQYLQEIISALSNYPVLDDEDVSRREHEQALDAIESEGYGVVSDEAPEDWAGQVFSWLWENKQEVLEQDTDGSVWVPEEAIREAAEALGFAEQEDWD